MGIENHLHDRYEMHDICPNCERPGHECECKSCPCCGEYYRSKSCPTCAYCIDCDEIFPKDELCNGVCLDCRKDNRTPGDNHEVPHP